jgi:hypothetical protein
MFKKIHSKRDSSDTLYSEIKKEFGGYFQKAGTKSRSFTERYPKLLFGLMVFCIILSISVVFALRKRPAPPPKITLSPVNDGITQVMGLSTALKETIALKTQVDSISQKKTLDKADSARLLNDLNRLQQINSTFKKQNYEH